MSIAVNDDEDEDDAQSHLMSKYTDTRKDFMTSFTAPKKFMEDTRQTDKEVDVCTKIQIEHYYQPKLRIENSQ